MNVSLSVNFILGVDPAGAPVVDVLYPLARRQLTHRAEYTSFRFCTRPPKTSRQSSVYKEFLVHCLLRTCAVGHVRHCYLSSNSVRRTSVETCLVGGMDSALVTEML